MSAFVVNRVLPLLALCFCAHSGSGYDSGFKHKQSAVETITPMLDKDGKWRVSGYYIK
ncbi:MAG: DUF4019 domain-containing protein [Candidatus Sulfotelmatobacter sp.]